MIKDLPVVAGLFMSYYTNMVLTKYHYKYYPVYK